MEPKDYPKAAVLVLAFAIAVIMMGSAVIYGAAFTVKLWFNPPWLAWADQPVLILVFAVIGVVVPVGLSYLVRPKELFPTFSDFLPLLYDDKAREVLRKDTTEQKSNK